ncbi:MAG: hypothetical protein HDR11_10760 [Lachnospiraceae bacterium]|nr:hypothetical protein [Lachnospiraceae bacterium]
MAKEKQSGRAVKIAGIVWGVTLLVTAIFYFVKAMLPAGVVYRVWLERAGTVWALFVLPLTLVVFLLCRLWKNAAKTRRAAAYMVVTVVALFGFMLYLMFASVYTWVLGLALGHETEFAPGIIKTQTENLDSIASYTTYYEDKGIFVKKEYEPMSDIVLLTMEMKYGEKFVIAGEAERADCYLLSPADNPALIFEVQEVMGGFTDNYETVQKENGEK